MVVGEGGIDPRYFFYEMGYGEVQMFIAGYNRRYRTSWEQHRSLVGTIAAVCGEKKDIRDLMPLPWDDGVENHNDEQDEDDLQELMNSLNAHNAQVRAAQG